SNTRKKVSIGTAAVFESAVVSYTSVAALSDTQAIVVYADAGNSNYGTACILDISGDTITPATPVVFDSVIVEYLSVAALSSTQAIVTYRNDSGSPEDGTACILDISGSTITPATPTVFENAGTQYTSVAKLTSTKAIVAYQDQGNNNHGKSCILDISGSTITPGVVVEFESGATTYISIAALSDIKAIVTFADGTAAGRACILDVSGSTITDGNPATFTATNTDYTSVTALSSTKALVAYKDNANLEYGTICTLEIDDASDTQAS
ncbi:unnamed protein product, partial [marine sediment metagenome]